MTRAAGVEYLQSILVLADPQPVGPDGIQLGLACDHVIAELKQRVSSER